MTNTYSKYCPNVFLAKCEQEYNKGDVIPVTTKHGKENDCIVFNLIYKRDGFYYYSIVREDGFNVQEYARRKAEKYQGYASNADKRSAEWYEKSNEGSAFLALGEPIKVGHHSESRHRALIDRNWNRMGKSVSEADKAEQYRHKAEYWEGKEDIINLSMPESIEYFEFLLEKAQIVHKGMKDGTIERRHSMSLQYAKKAVNELQTKLELAQKLWGDN